MSDEMKVTINGREYPVTPPFTNRELHVIKQISGVRAGEIFDAMDAGDNDVIVALAHIAVVRTKAARPTLDELWDLPAGSISFVVPEDEDKPVDPTSAPDSGAAATPGSPETGPSSDGDPSTGTSST